MIFKNLFHNQKRFYFSNNGKRGVENEICGLEHKPRMNEISRLAPKSPAKGQDPRTFSWERQ